MWSRRSFLRVAGGLGAGAVAARGAGLADVAAATQSVAGRSPDEVAADEFYWREIQSAFTLDRTIINLNNGNQCPSPTVVHDAMKRYTDWANQAPIHHRQAIERNLETVRRRLAREFGCDAEELAITRNASEALQIAQNGIDLAPGDEVVTTEQDYPRMLTTWDQRERRDRIKVVRINFKVPTTADDLYARIEAAITPRTKVVHICHCTNLTGQMFPVQRISRMARSRGIRTIVDGAHAVAHWPFQLRDLECDYYGTSLHKWLLAPLGTGFLYVRRELIESTWPLQAAPATRATDIRKFEEIGTAPPGPKAAISEAIAFHQAIGAERKAARLRYLTLRWANRLKANPRVRIHSDLAPGQTYGVACVSVDGIDTDTLAAHLWDRHRIIVTPVGRGEPVAAEYRYRGLRITPNIYTPLDEIDQFAEAIEDVLRRGLA
ncbi:MAG: aminotransferase class V-fold PLP-dependent enzyme [Acidobacteriota bacterium]